MKIRITRTIKKVGWFNKSFELEETVFLDEIEEDDLYTMINAIGMTKRGFTSAGLKYLITTHSVPTSAYPTKQEALDLEGLQETFIDRKSESPHQTPQE